MDELFPPAITRTSAHDLIASGQVIAERLAHHERASLEDAAELGRIINQLRSQGDGLQTACIKWDISERSARDYGMIARLKATDLAKCNSIREALEIAPREQERKTGSTASSESQAEKEVAKARAKRVGQKPPTPFPTSSARSSESSADVDTAEPEEERAKDEPGDLAREIARIGARMEDATKRLSNCRKIEGREVGSSIVLARSWVAWGTGIAMQQEVVDPPRETKCGQCGATVLLVTTTKNRKMNVDPEMGGPTAQFALFGGRAVMVADAYKDRSFLYTAHFKTCSRGIR